MIERIEIAINFVAEFWDQPPMIDIMIDKKIISSHIINLKNYSVCDTVDLDMGQDHLLQIRRYNKSDDQCVMINGEKKDQYVIVQDVILDGIDIRNLIWHRSWYEPQYPEVWAQQQNTTLESEVIGETWLSHNGTWNFAFSSPVYKFIISQFKN